MAKILLVLVMLLLPICNVSAQEKSIEVEERDVTCTYYTKKETKIKFNIKKGVHAVDCYTMYCPGGRIITMLNRKGAVKCTTTLSYDSQCNLIVQNDGCEIF